MYEFDSVSVSSFEASQLAGKLSERAADGWDVVSIITAGSDVVAYLRRGDSANGQDAPATTSGNADASTGSATPIETTTSGESVPVAGGVGWASGGSSATTPSAQPADSGQAASGERSWGTGAGAGSWSGSAQQTPATPPAAAATPAVPAGWYADPAGRFELRYWDGTAWTEHVSRAGQQSIDPPVA